MKDKHEKLIKKILSAMKGKKGQPIKEKIRSFQNHKIECVNKFRRCKGKSRTGTIFTETADEYRVQCGDVNNGCGLDVYVKKKPTRTLFDLLNESTQNLSKNQLQMIQLHMNVLFGVVNDIHDQPIDEYTNILRELKQNKENYERYVRMYDSVVQNKQHAHTETVLTHKIESDLNEIRELLSSKQQSLPPTDSNIQDAIYLYKTSLYKNATRLRNIQKPLRNVLVDIDSKKTIVKVEYQYNRYNPEDLDIKWRETMKR